MTKAAEIRLLASTIKKFGPDSYIGPWLKSHEKEITQAIADDLPIYVSDLIAAPEA